MDLQAVLHQLDLELIEQSQAVDLIICGAAAVSLKFHRETSTLDVDCMTRLELEVRRAAAAVAKSKVGSIENLNEDWLNDAVVQKVGLPDRLPDGWEERARASDPVFEGRNLVVYSLCSDDLLRTKLLAIFDEYRDVDKDFSDIKKMGFAADKILAEAPWVSNAMCDYGEIYSVKEIEEAIKNRISKW